MHLDGGEPHGFQGVEDGDGGVGVGGGVQDDGVGGAVGALDLGDDVSFAVGLKEGDLDAEIGGGALDAADEGGVIRFAVEVGLANAEHVDVRTVDDRNFHRTSPG